MQRFFQRKKKQPSSENAKSTNENEEKVDNNTNTNNNVEANSDQEEKLSTPRPASTSTSTSTSSFEYTPHDELYGQIIPRETPELLSTKLNELEIELNQIPNDSKKEYMEALQKCPTLKNNKSNNNNNNSDEEHENEHSESHKKFKLMFLRCEVFDCTLAAKRIVKYWAKRVQIFGIEQAYQPLTLLGKGPFLSTTNNNEDSDDAGDRNNNKNDTSNDVDIDINNKNKNDTQALKIGFIRHTNSKDKAGRPVLFADPSRLPSDQSSYDNYSIARALWYVIHATIDNDETAQRKGVVMIVYPKNIKFAQFNRTLVKLNAESIKGCIPIRISALHICHPPVVFDLIFPIVKMTMGPKLRKKIKLNNGSENDVLEKFEEKFGLSKEDLPSEIGGLLVLDHELWLEERMKMDC